MLIHILFALAALFYVVVIVLGSLRPKSKAAPSVAASYRPVSFVSPAEQKFFTALQSYVAQRAVVLSKVRLADLAQPIAARRTYWQGSFNKIASKHVDFVLCDSKLSPLCVLELDDSSHDRLDRRNRDKFVDSVLQDIGLPILHVPCRFSYSPSDFMALDKFLKNI